MTASTLAFAGRAVAWRSIAFVLLPFAAGYYLTYLFRTINVSIRGRPPFQEWEERDASQLSWLYERGKLRSMGRMTLITGAERRRRWGKEDRARILAAIEEPGAVVAEVARAADVCTSLVYKWRREARSAAPKNDVSGFASVVVEAPMAAPPSLPSTTNSEPGVIVVDMRDARVRIAADAPTAVIAATLKALRP